MAVDVPRTAAMALVCARGVVVIMPEHEFPKLKPHPAKGGVGPARQSRSTDTAALPYVELSVTSNFTFLTGASHPEEMVEQAAALGYRAIALTDINTLAGIIRGHVAAKQAGVQYIPGSRLVLEEPAGLSLLVYPTCM